MARPSDAKKRKASSPASTISDATALNGDRSKRRRSRTTDESDDELLCETPESKSKGKDGAKTPNQGVSQKAQTMRRLDEIWGNKDWGVPKHIEIEELKDVGTERLNDYRGISTTARSFSLGLKCIWDGPNPILAGVEQVTQLTHRFLQERLAELKKRIKTANKIPAAQDTAEDNSAATTIEVKPPDTKTNAPSSLGPAGPETETPSQPKSTTKESGTHFDRRDFKDFIEAQR